MVLANFAIITLIHIVNKITMIDDVNAGLCVTDDISLSSRSWMKMITITTGRNVLIKRLRSVGAEKNLTGRASGPEAVITPRPRKKKATAVGKATGIMDPP